LRIERLWFYQVLSKIVFRYVGVWRTAEISREKRCEDDGRRRPCAQLIKLERLDYEPNQGEAEKDPGEREEMFAVVFRD
jgi:hypothetical protein